MIRGAGSRRARARRRVWLTLLGTALAVAAAATGAASASAAGTSGTSGTGTGTSTSTSSSSDAGAASANGAAIANAARAALGGDSSAAFSMLPAAPRRNACEGWRGAFLRARLRGALNLDIAWRDRQLRCDGDGDGDGRRGRRGMRVSFEGRTPDRRHRLLFVFGIDAPARPGGAHEVATNVTIILEGERCLYSTRGDPNCTVGSL
jgi:hypothetical protein